MYCFSILLYLTVHVKASIKWTTPFLLTISVQRSRQCEFKSPPHRNQCEWIIPYKVIEYYRGIMELIGSDTTNIYFRDDRFFFFFISSFFFFFCFQTNLESNEKFTVQVSSDFAACRRALRESFENIGPRKPNWQFSYFITFILPIISAASLMRKSMLPSMKTSKFKYACVHVYRDPFDSKYWYGFN